MSEMTYLFLCIRKRLLADGGIVRFIGSEYMLIRNINEVIVCL